MKKRTKCSKNNSRLSPLTRNKELGIRAKNVSIFILFQKNVFIRAETRIVYVWFILWESEAPVISMECEQDVMRLPLFGLFSHPQ